MYWIAWPFRLMGLHRTRRQAEQAIIAAGFTKWIIKPCEGRMAESELDKLINDALGLKLELRTRRELIAQYQVEAEWLVRQIKELEAKLSD